MAFYDTIVRGGLLVDGTGAPASHSDVAISGGRIAKIGNLLGDEASETIDARGKVVAPGHVMQHAHHDAQLFWDPYCSNSGEHGVTTLVNANCGFSIAPVRPKDRERTMLMLSTTEQIPVEQQRSALPWNWETFPEYLDRLRGLPKGVNVMTYLPLNPLLVYVMGIDRAKTARPTAPEMAEMHRLINEAMDAGAAGISMSVMGIAGNSHLDFDGTAMPSDLLHDDDIVELSRAVANRGEGIIQMLSHIYHFGNPGVTEKVARMAKGSGARVIYAALHTSDSRPQVAINDLRWIEDLRAEGLDISGGALINRGWLEAGINELDTSAGQLSGIREIVACGTDERRLALLADPVFIRRFEEEYGSAAEASGSAGIESLVIVEVGDALSLRPLVGRRIDEIANERGRSAVATLCELGVETDMQVEFKSGNWAANDPAQVKMLLASPGVAAGVSDAGAHTKAFANGHYATELLIWLVRESKAFSIEEMHYQLAFKVARTLGLSDRGALLPGFAADLLIYDPEALYFERDRYLIAHDMPNGDWRRNANAGGYDRILVNGVTTHIADRSTGATPGELLSITRPH